MEFALANREAIFVKILVLIPDDSKSITKSGFIWPQCSSICLTNEEKEVLILVFLSLLLSLEIVKKVALLSNEIFDMNLSEE
jgi:hypothetical protein